MLRSLCFAALAGLIFVSRPVAAQAPESTYRFEPRPYSADMTVGELLENPSTRAVVLAHIPAFASLPIDAVARRPLRAVRPLAPQVVSAEALARVDADLRKLPPSAEAVQAARRAESEAAAAVLDPAQPWITAREALMADYERRPITLQFRRELELPAKLRKLEVQVSADNRFVLYVNGQRVAAGPSRGDLLHWRYTTIDLAPYLRAGRNIIAAEVWNEGEFAPLAQVSAGHTGFMLRAVDEGFRTIDTGPSWRVRLDRSRSVANGLMQVAGAVGRTYYVAGAPETLDGRAVVANWMAATTTVNGWVAPVAAVTKGEKQRRLVADTLPPMRYKLIPSGKVVRSSRADLAAFPARRVTVPANTEATLLIDAGRVLAAYPVLRTSAGAAATVSLTYTEALYDPARKPGGASPGKEAWPRFADRSTVADGLALGLTDNFQLAGGAERFAPLWWRAWRFVEVKVKTGAEPVVLEALETYETGYPFQQRGYFRSNDPELNKVWEIGWRTGLVDAHETYQDTAYWEQLQYIGDTRIQALLSYDVAGDPRLAEQAIRAYDHSRVVDGLPQSAWPSSGTNSIPPFALLWIGMLHDYWMRHPDPTVLRESLPGMRSVLEWYRGYVRDNGMVRATPGWRFVDWRPGLDGDNQERSGKGPDSCVISLQFVGALQEAADLEQALGEAGRASENRALAAKVGEGVRSQCWDQGKGLFANTPEKTSFSQHANVLAVLHDVAPKEQQAAMLDRVTVRKHGIDAPAGITGTTYYFSFYLAKALAHAGLAERYPELMETWRQMARQNFTTWPENPDPSRSDSHAWSAHPTSGLLTYVAGIEPAAPGFARVSVTPHLGKLTMLEAAIVHPEGLVVTSYVVQGGKLSARIDLPLGVTGTFNAGGKQWPLHPGRNRINVAADQPGT